MSVVNNNRIEAPISFSDVNQVLGTSHTDLASLVIDTHINKWEKYKPIRSSIIAFLTYQQRYLLDFGLNIPRLGQQGNTFRSLAIKLMQYRDGTLGQDIAHWEYLKPRGSSNNEPYRLQDFCRNPNEASQSTRFDNGDPTNASVKGYYHNAQIPVDIYMLSRSGITFDNEYKYEVNLQATGTITIYAYQPTDMKGLHLFDLVAIDNQSQSLANPHYRIVVEKWRNQTLIARYPSDPIWDNYSNYYIDVDVSDGTANSSVELVVGLQKTTVTNGTINYLEGTDNFIPPFDDAEWNMKRYPFYYFVTLRSYAAIKAEILRTAQNVGYASSGLFTWTTYAWMVNSNISGSLWAKMHLSQLTSGVSYQFVDGNTEPDSGKVGVRFGIQEREKIILDSNNVPSNLITVTPSNSSRQTQTKVNISVSSLAADIYFIASVFDTNSDSQYYINNGNVHNFQLYVKTKTGSSWSAWAEAEWLGIKKGTA